MGNFIETPKFISKSAIKNIPPLTIYQIDKESLREFKRIANAPRAVSIEKAVPAKMSSNHEFIFEKPEAVYLQSIKFSSSEINNFIQTGKKSLGSKIRIKVKQSAPSLKSSKKAFVMERNLMPHYG